MAPRSIALTEENDRIVDDLVRSGRFSDAGAVVREGLRLVAEEVGEEDFGYTFEELRTAIQVGLDDLENGRSTRFKNADDLAAHIRGRTDDLLSGKRNAR